MESKRIMERYQASFIERDFEKMLDLYDEEAVLFTRFGLLHRPEMKPFFQFMIEEAPKAYFENLRIIAQHYSKNTVHYTYQSPPVVPLGTNTWKIEGSKITSQTFTTSNESDFISKFFQFDNHETVNASTNEVIQKHFSAFGSGEGRIIAENFAENGFISTPLGTVTGRKEIEVFMDFALKNISRKYINTVETVFSHVENETGYIVYTAKPFVEMGTDTWHISDGKILSQTYTSYPILDYIKDFFE